MLKLAVFNSLKYSFNKKSRVSNRARLRGVRYFQLPDWSRCSIVGPSDDVDVEHDWMPEKGASHAKGGSHPKHSEEKKGEDAHLDSKFVSSILASGFSILATCF